MRSGSGRSYHNTPLISLNDIILNLQLIIPDRVDRNNPTGSTGKYWKVLANHRNRAQKPDIKHRIKRWWIHISENNKKRNDDTGPF